MNDEKLRSAVATIPRLRACVVLGARRSTVRAKYRSPAERWSDDELATVVRRVHAGVSEVLALVGGGDAQQLLVDASGRRLVFQTLSNDHVAAFIFDRDAKLGMVRHRVEGLKATLEASLGESRGPSGRGTELLRYLERHAADTHAALLRVSLQTGLPMMLLREPDALSEAELESVSASVRQILGVHELGVER